MVNSVASVSNNSKTNVNVGIITPPDSHYKPILFSNSQAEKDFKQLNYDVYKGMNKVKPAEKHKTPTLIKILLGFAGIALLYPVVKGLIKR